MQLIQSDNLASNLSLTGIPLAPTAAVSTNTTQIASTAFVIGQAATVAPVMNGVSAVGTSLTFARQDHVHPSDTSKLSTTGGTVTGTGITISGTGTILLSPSGDITAYRTGGTTGVLFLNQAANRYLYYNGTNYDFATTGGTTITVGGTAVVLNNGGTYSLNISGTAANATLYNASIVAVSRAFNTSYTNSSGKPMTVYIQVAHNALGTLINYLINGTPAAQTFDDGGRRHTVTLQVPNGFPYSITVGAGVGAIVSVYEQY